ncbi:MAG: DUF4388 domain-containing protein [Myxococcota bacterium]
MGIERRRSPRIRASLEIQLVGLDARPVMRRGDLSVTGLRVGMIGVDVGQPGSLHRMRVATRDGEQRVEVQARVVRVVRSFCIDTGDHIGDAAFEFVPRDAVEREELAMLFVHVARAQIRYDENGVRPASEPPELTGSAVRSIVVETDWKLRKGEEIRIDIPSKEGGAVRFRGTALRSRRSSKGTYRTHFDLKRESDSFVASRPGRLAQHLSGDLSRIRAPSLLSLAAMERMTGVLDIEREDRFVTVYVRDGQVVDAEESGSTVSRRKLIGEVCQWEAGAFEMRLEAVDRPDGIGVPTSVLLLQLARFYDEAKRVA